MPGIAGYGSAGSGPPRVEGLPPMTGATAATGPSEDRGASRVARGPAAKRLEAKEPYRATLMKKFLGDQLQATKRARPRQLRSARLPKLDEGRAVEDGMPAGAIPDDDNATSVAGSHAKWWRRGNQAGKEPSYPPTAITSRAGEGGTASEVAEYRERVEALEAQMEAERARRAETEQQMAELLAAMKSKESGAGNGALPSTTLPRVQGKGAPANDDDAASMAGSFAGSLLSSARLRPNPITGRIEYSRYP